MPSVGRYLRRALLAAFVAAAGGALPARAQTLQGGRWHHQVAGAWWFAPETEPGAAGAGARAGWRLTTSPF